MTKSLITLVSIKDKIKKDVVKEVWANYEKYKKVSARELEKAKETMCHEKYAKFTKEHVEVKNHPVYFTMKEEVKKEKEITYPCIYVATAGSGGGPILIPEEHSVSEESVIKYAMDLMEGYIRGRAVICWDEKGIKKSTVSWRDKSGKPYIVID